VQWQFDEQAGALKAYANERGVHLMGDLPIFVAHDSADCWSRPDLYHLDDEFQTTVVAGVPPDDLGPPASAGATRCTAGTAWPPRTTPGGRPA
jgi:4-alpha-glucanotransferase